MSPLPLRRLFAVGLFAVMASGTALKKHGHRGQQASVEAAADADAQAVIEAAEKGSQTPDEEEPQATQLSSTYSGEHGSVVVNSVKQEADKDEDSDEDDSDDDDDEKSTGSPGSVVTMEADPGEKKTLHVTYGVNDGILRGESLTPSGALTKARQQLQDNLYQQTKVNSLIWQMGNETAFQGQVDAEAKDLANETQAQALAMMLGGMRKEMRKFASPFFLDHLYSERKRLKAEEVELQAQLESSEAGMGGGHQGFPHPGDKVVVAESTFRRPASLRGSEDGEPASDDEVKELKVSMKKDTSLLQQHSLPEKSSAAALSGLGAMALAGWCML